MISYVGNCLEIYKGESLSLKDIQIAVLFNNGKDSVVTLEDVSYTKVDYSELGIEKNITITYEGKQTLVPYKVVCREIVDNEDYNLIDNIGLYGEFFTVSKEANNWVVYDSLGEEKDNLTLVDKGNNEFVVRNKFYNGDVYNILVYRVDNTIVIEKIEE